MKDINDRIASLSPEKRALLQLRLAKKPLAATPVNSIPKRLPREAHCPLTFAQQRLWFLEQLSPDSGLYNIPLGIKLSGDLNIAPLEFALNALVVRHESLRTTFVSSAGEPLQRIADCALLKLNFADVSSRESSTREAEAMALARNEARQPFDLASDLMIRALLIKLAPYEHYLILTMHHIASDGWSVGILCKELGLLYEAATQGRTAMLPGLAVQYADFASWQRKWFTEGVLKSQMDYWKAKLAGALPVLRLPLSRPRPAIQSYKGACVNATFPESLTAALKTFSESRDASLFMTLLAAFQTLLMRYSGQADILVGTPIAGRTRVETESLIGLFTNTVVMRGNLAGNPKFSSFLSQIRKTALEAYSNQDLPFEKLVEELQPARGNGHSPLFQVMFVLQNSPASEIRWPHLACTTFFPHTGTSKFDLTLSMEESDGALKAMFEYNTAIFDESVIAQALHHFQTLLECIVVEPDERVGSLGILTQGEQSLLLHQWNNTGTDYPSQACVHELFQRQAAMTPDAAAVTFGNTTLTYGQLNERANRVANYLIANSVGPEVLVGICMERSLELIVGTLGILKAGGGYLPLDPAYPKERLSFMIDDTRTPVLLTQRKVSGKLPAHSARVIYLEHDMEDFPGEDAANPNAKAMPGNVAYVTYTSGSTGKPKGVCIPHRGVVRLVKSTGYASFNSKEVFMQFAPISFDASTFEIWGALLNGARLVVFPPHLPTLQELGQELRKHKVTTLWLTSGLFNQMVEDNLEGLGGVRQLLSGGDALSVPHVRKARGVLQSCRLINGYGPTESTTFTCCHTIEELSTSAGSVPIGRPIANTSVYLLDRAMKPVPVGFPGELYIGGDGLARGYHNRPELTAEKFVPNPFAEAPGARLYKTGDLARYLENGAIEFMGRIDNQVKIRGFRIEPGEIENILSQHPSVAHCTVIVREDNPGEKMLAGYVVPVTGKTIAAGEIRAFLKQKMPEYMVPSALMILQSLPLTVNGKVDRKALPAPMGNPDAGQRVISEIPLHRQLVEIWEDLLHVKPIGIRDNFFDLGGHSLMAVRMMDRIEHICGKKLPLTTLFDGATIEHIADAILKQSSLEVHSPLVKLNTGGTRRPLFFLHGDILGRGLYCYNLARHLGADQPLNVLHPREVPPNTDAPSIEVMAAEYIQTIRQESPAGPYRLAGFCMGGLLALEIAQQLKAQGETVEMVVLIDFELPRRVPKWISRAVGRAGKMLGRDHDTRSRWLKRALAEYVRFHDLMGMDVRSRFRRLSRAAGRIRKKFGRAISRAPVNAQASPPEQSLDQLWAFRWSILDYDVRRYDGRVRLIFSSELAKSADEPATAWRNVAADLAHSEVPGDHMACLTTYASVLAETLNKYLSEAGAEKVRTPMLQTAHTTEAAAV